MNVKKEVFENLKAMINEEIKKCENKIRKNKYYFKALEQEQTVLKREKSKLYSMLNDLIKPQREERE